MNWERYDRLREEIADLRREIERKEQECTELRAGLSGTSRTSVPRVSNGTSAVDGPSANGTKKVPPKFIVDTAEMVNSSSKPVRASDLAAHFKLSNHDANARLWRACSEFHLIRRVKRGLYAGGA